MVVKENQDTFYNFKRPKFVLSDNSDLESKLIG